MRTWLLLLVLLACGAECAFAQDEDSTKTALPAGTRVRIEYRSAHDITVGTLVRGGPDTLIVRPEAILRDARFLTKDVRDFAWWYQRPRLGSPRVSRQGLVIGVAAASVVGLMLALAGSDSETSPFGFGPAEAIGGAAVVVTLGGAALVAIRSAAPGGEWVHQPLSDIRFVHATTRAPGATIALTMRR